MNGGTHTPLDSWRNRFAVRLCNFVLRTVASSSYRVTLTAIVLRGMESDA
jgi:hypothetical protein